MVGGRRPGPDRGAARHRNGPPARAARTPIRAHGRVTVRVLARVGGDHGGRPRHHAPFRPPRAGVRRRAHRKLPPPRHARTRAQLRPERLRRDTAGAVRMGFEAARGQCDRRRALQRLLGARVPPHRDEGRPLVPPSHCGVRRPERTRHLVLAHRRRDARSRPETREPPREAEPAHPQAHEPARATRVTSRHCAGSPPPSTATTRLHEDPPLLYPRASRRRARRRASCTPTEKVCATTCKCCSTATSSSTTRSGWAASGVSAPAAGSRCSRVTTGTPTTPSSCR